MSKEFNEILKKTIEHLNTPEGKKEFDTLFLQEIIIQAKKDERRDIIRLINNHKFKKGIDYNYIENIRNQLRGLLK